MPSRIVQGLEELRSLVGQEVAVSDWLTLTQERINAFADVIDDHQWIHVDTARARSELPNGKTIAHGFLTLSMLSYLLRESLQIKTPFRQGINYGFNRIRFPYPVPAGAEMRARCTLQSVTDVQDGVQLSWAVVIEINGAPKPALVADWLVRYSN